MGKKKTSYSMIWVIISFIIVFFIIKIVSPYVFKVLLAKGHTMPTPSTLVLWYMILAVTGALVYVSASILRWANFFKFYLACR